MDPLAGINKNELWKTILPFFILAFIIFVLNIIPIWGFDGLIQDDQEYYYRLYNKGIFDLTFSRNIIQAIYILEIIKIASFTSIFTARLLIILLLSIPSASLIYYFSHYEFNLRKSTSVAIAAIPFILPNEVFIPTYIVGSYMLLAILFALITIYFILKYSRESEFSTTYFVLAAASFGIAFESSELIASMLPVFLFLIFIFRKFSRKQLLLGAVFSLMAVLKSILVIIRPHGPVNNVRNEIPVPEIKDRIVNFLDFMNPFHTEAYSGILNIIVVGIIILGAVIVLMNPARLKNILDPTGSKDEPVNKHFYFVYYYLFPLVWLVFSSLPFLVFAQYMTSRYFTTAAIALNFMFIISLGVIFGLFTWRRLPLVITLILITGVSGYNRQQNFRKYYLDLNNQYSELKQTLSNYDLPRDAQIIVTSYNRRLALGYGITRRSIGVYQYVLKNRDVGGQIMIEKHFYDPFLLINKAWLYRYVDIDTTKSTFLFRCFNAHTGQNRRLHYALRWEDEISKESNWSIFHFDEHGHASNLVSGNGYESYKSTLDSLSTLGIRREDIMFGGIPTRADSARLGLRQ
jgi:hypothetical protein